MARRTYRKLAVSVNIDWRVGGAKKRISPGGDREAPEAYEEQARMWF
jgi:hypothetical protein